MMCNFQLYIVQFIFVIIIIMQAYTFSHNAMATTFRVALYADTRGYARQAAWALFDEVDRVEKELSKFYPLSDISRINSLPAGEQTLVSADTLDVLKLSYSLWRDTGGAFDITTASAIDSAGTEELHGFDACHIDPDAFTVTVLHDGLQCDLGGIGKGYALDCMADLLDDWDITTALMHSGESSVLPVGTPSEENAWTIALRHPEYNSIITSVEIKDMSVSGSGMMIHGEHIIDPRTGKPADIRKAAWAFAPGAAVSDALSTAFMIMSLEEIEAFCQSHPGTGALLYEPGEGREPLKRVGVNSG
jgi:thiamine biosynthesis lipoprotein